MAAIRSGSNLIVTFNLKHFPESTLATYGIDAQHPDEFVMHLLDIAAPVVCAAARRQRQNLKHPAKSVEEYLAGMERQGLAQTVAGLRRFAELI